MGIVRINRPCIDESSHFIFVIDFFNTHSGNIHPFVHILVDIFYGGEATNELNIYMTIKLEKEEKLEDPESDSYIKDKYIGKDFYEGDGIYRRDEDIYADKLLPTAYILPTIHRRFPAEKVSLVDHSIENIVPCRFIQRALN